MAEPAAPDAETREQLLGVVAEYVARAGAEPLLLAPVAPGPAAFPEPWAPTRAGIVLLLQRLAWHAGLDREIAIEDRRAGGPPPTERMPETRVELFELRGKTARFALGFIGRDDVAGTLAHEIGTAFAAAHRKDDGAAPYRSAEPPVISIDPEVDLARGSIAAVYVGLGVLAANAAFQQYSRAGRFNGAYEPLDYDVLRAGHVPMSALAYLVAVQAVVRGDDAPPPGLEPPQRDEVIAWLAALRGKRAELRLRLGIAADAQPGTRPQVVRFADVALEDDPAAPKIAFRWHTHRGGVGVLAGLAIGAGVAVAIATRDASVLAVLGGAAAGHVIGRRVDVPRCSACATVVAADATTCRSCGALLRGDIARLADRLEAEERLDDL
ncbi:MAG: zinc ribbon domain-containing protein [Acidobacteriota bacterium]